MKRLFTALVAAILALVSPVTHAVVKVKNEIVLAISTLFPITGSILVPAPPSSPVSELEPLDTSPGTIFINKLLIQDSSFGLVQITGAPTNYLGGFGYSPENYLKVTLDTPNNPHYVEGIAVNSAGVVHIYDASSGLPSGTRFVGGLLLTSTGQLCVIIA